MDVRELVRTIHLRAQEKGFAVVQSCIGIGPFNWIFRHDFPSLPGIYWFYVDQQIKLSNGLVLKAKEVVYIGMTGRSIKVRLGEHMIVSRYGQGADPWGAGEGWEFAGGTLFKNHELHKHRTQESADLVRTGQLWVGWFCLTAPTDDPNALASLESEIIAQVKLDDGAKPFFNIND